MDLCETRDEVFYPSGHASSNVATPRRGSLLRIESRPLNRAACRLALIAALIPLGMEACGGTPASTSAPAPTPARAPTSTPTTAPARPATPAATKSLSTLSGVYTREQASRGKEVYANLCKSCHNPSTGDTFAKRWAGKTLFDMFTFIYENMPDNNPRSVDEASNADIIGYLLQSTGMPVGTHDVPAAPDSLKAIHIEIKNP